MNFLFQVVIPAISGLVSGTIASLVAPWINWRIEQKREKLAYKKEMIRRWRQFLDRDRDFGGERAFRLSRLLRNASTS
jgi:hypothetical protein